MKIKSNYSPDEQQIRINKKLKDKPMKIVMLNVSSLQLPEKFQKICGICGPTIGIQ